MNHTTNYNLPQWEDSDRVTRSDVNDAMSAIDAAIAGAGVKFATGSYVGDGVCGTNGNRRIDVGFAAKLIAVVRVGGDTSTCNRMFAVRGQGYVFTGFDGICRVGWGDDYVTLWHVNGTQSNADREMNANGTTYYWCAIG